MDDEDLLDRLLGRVVRSSAELDMTLRSVAYQLVLPGGVVGWKAAEDELRLAGMGPNQIRTFEGLLRLIKRHNVASKVPDDLTRERITRVVEAAATAYKERNRVVHDPPLPIHPPEREPGGATHRRIRLDVAEMPVDVDPQTLAGLVRELLLLSSLAHSLAMTLLERRMEVHGGRPTLDVDSFHADLWQEFDSRPIG